MVARGTLPCIGCYFLRFRCNSPLPADKHHGTRGWYEVRGIDAVTFLFFVDDRMDIGNEIVICCTFSQQGPQIVIVLAEQAGAQLAVGREADARAMAAEGLRDGSEQADLSGCSVGKPILASGLAALMGDLFQRPEGMNAAVNLR